MLGWTSPLNVSARLLWADVRCQKNHQVLKKTKSKSRCSSMQTVADNTAATFRKQINEAVKNYYLSRLQLLSVWLNWIICDWPWNTVYCVNSNIAFFTGLCNRVSRYAARKRQTAILKKCSHNCPGDFNLQHLTPWTADSVPPPAAVDPVASAPIQPSCSLRSTRLSGNGTAYMGRNLLCAGQLHDTRVHC